MLWLWCSYGPPPAAPPHPVPLSRLWRIAERAIQHTTINPVLMKVLKPFPCFEGGFGGGRGRMMVRKALVPNFIWIFETYFTSWFFWVMPLLCGSIFFWVFCLRKLTSWRLHILQLAGPVNTTDSWAWGELRIIKQQSLTWNKNRWIIVRMGVLHRQCGHAEHFFWPSFRLRVLPFHGGILAWLALVSEGTSVWNGSWRDFYGHCRMSCTVYISRTDTYESLRLAGRWIVEQHTCVFTCAL